MDLWYNFIDFLTTLLKSPEFQTAIVVFKILFLIISLSFISVAVWFKFKSGFFAERAMYFSYYFDQKKKPDQGTELPLKELKEYWDQLGLRLNMQDDAQWKLAVIEADNFFDHVLTLLGYKGESMGERLQKVLPQHLPNINDVWRVHKVRNSLVHDATYRLSYSQARDVYDTYEKALKQLKILS